MHVILQELEKFFSKNKKGFQTGGAKRYLKKKKDLTKCFLGLSTCSTDSKHIGTQAYMASKDTVVG